MAVPVALTMSLALGMAFGVHTAKDASFRFWPLPLAMLGAWVCLEAVLSVEWICRSHNPQESLAVGQLILQLPFHVLIVAPAAISCGVLQRFGPRLGGGLVSMVRAFATILASATGFGGAGCLVGYLLGRLAPGYYRAVFRNGNDPNFDPVAVGVGLGLTQGIIAGLMVGAVVVLAVAWSRSRIGGNPRHAQPVAPARRPRE